MFWLNPFEDCFNITFWFGEKAASVVQRSDIPENVIHSLIHAQKYTIKRSIQIIVKQIEDIETVRNFFVIKNNNESVTPNQISLVFRIELKLRARCWRLMYKFMFAEREIK